MYLEHISLTNFRNYSSLDLALGSGPIVLCGDNAQGKSNLLEAIYLLATTKSPRANSDRELVRWGALEDPLSVLRLVGDVHRANEKLRIEMALGLDAQPAGAGGGADTGGEKGSSYLRKQIKVNGVPRRASDVVGQLNVVLFGPMDVDLVGGPPAQRRRYLDLTNSQVDRAYLRALQRYSRVLTQRNHLLRLIREGSAQREELSFWDEQLVEDGCFILCKRREMVIELADISRVIYSELAGGAEALELTYLPNPSELRNGESDWTDQGSIRELFHRQLAANQDREVAQGVSVVGPHRDDLQFLIDGRDMGVYGSRGQQRTIIAALKLAEANFLVNRTGEDPVLLLDDILSELDAPRRQQVLETALSNQQTFITTTDLDRIGEGFLSHATVLKVQDGQLNPIYSVQ